MSADLRRLEIDFQMEKQRSNDLSLQLGESEYRVKVMKQEIQQLQALKLQAHSPHAGSDTFKLPLQNPGRDELSNEGSQDSPRDNFQSHGQRGST